MAKYSDEEVRNVVAHMFSRIGTEQPFYDRLRDYHRGKQMRPRIPNSADATLHELVDRSTVNLMRLAVNIPAQLSFIDGFSHVGPGEDEVELDPPEWDTWKKSGFRAQQTNLFRTVLKYGAAYVLVDTQDDEPRLRLLPTRDTVAYFADPVNDRVPLFAMTVERFPTGGSQIVFWDDTRMMVIPAEGNLGTWNSDWLDSAEVVEHGLGECPVVRYVCELDDEGNTTGIVEPLIPPQDRVNQTTFDLLTNQTFGAFGVRWAAGLAGEPYIDPETGEVLKDENGMIQYKPMQLSQARMFMTDNPDARFGTLEGTPVDGFISALESAIKTFAVMGNIPPHSLLGSMNNLSGETIEAAMGQTNRFTHMLRTSWGESTAELMRLIRKARGIDEVEGQDTQVRWREMSDQSMAAVVDALGKASQMLGVPGEGLWSRIPGTEDSELRRWRTMAESSYQAETYGATDPVSSSTREAETLSIVRGSSVGTGTGAGSAE